MACISFLLKMPLYISNYTPFFKLGIAMEKCRAKNLFKKGVKKGVKSPKKV